MLSRSACESASTLYQALPRDKYIDEPTPALCGVDILAALTCISSWLFVFKILMASRFWFCDEAKCSTDRIIMIPASWLYASELIFGIKQASPSY